MERPGGQDRAGWHAYWDQHGLFWRTEPEISPSRQEELSARRSQPGVGTAPFAGMRLDRADIEWLLATHQSRGIQGPIDDEDPTQRFREGLNLQGVDVRQAKLGGLPLARVNLSTAHLEKANFNQAHLERANFALSHLEGANFTKAHLFDASFRQAVLHDASFTEAHMASANLYQAQCRNASFYIANLEGAYLGQANFALATMRRAFVDAATSWNDAVLWDEQHVTLSMADVRWNGANLATVDWSQVRMIGDEREAHSRTDRDGKPKDRQKWRDNYRRSVRANRQLAVVLRAQGMNEEADLFAYRAQICQRQLLRRQGKWLAYLGSGFLDLLAGYGYKPLRTLFVYLIVIFGYGVAYLSQGNGALSPLAALIFSVTSFHGRGFFPGGLALDDGITVVAATEAIVGLVIEVSFIATFTQRFFAR
jgi:uncharacterized protein YjbI with pentapeptide repeats